MFLFYIVVRFGYLSLLRAVDVGGQKTQMLFLERYPGIGSRYLKEVTVPPSLQRYILF